MFAVTLRNALDQDDRALRRLAGLDTRPVPAAPVLVAERDGRIDAAISASTGEVIADPFRPTADLRELLRAKLGSR